MGVCTGGYVGVYDRRVAEDQTSYDRRFEHIIGNGAALQSALEQVERVATNDSTVLIQGETGTG